MSVKNILYPNETKFNAEFGDIHCDELFADKLTIDTFETNSIETNSIETNSILTNIIQPNDFEFIKIDKIEIEDNKLRAVVPLTDIIIDSNLMANNIENINLKVDDIRPNNNNYVLLRKNRALTITQEFARYVMQFNSVGDLLPYVSATGLTSNNLGDTDYLPQVSGNNFIIPNAGIYSFQLFTNNTQILAAGQFFALQIENLTTNEILANQQAKVENQVSINAFVISCTFIGYLDAGVSIKLGMRQVNSPGGLHNFNGKLLMSRLK
jgi:hypothetical protein